MQTLQIDLSMGQLWHDLGQGGGWVNLGRSSVAPHLCLSVTLYRLFKVFGLLL